MPAIYSTQSALQNSIYPTNDNYEPIPNLKPLQITDDFLYFGGTAFLTLFLGYAYTEEVSFSFYVNIIETTTNQVVAEVFFGGVNGLSTTISLSTVYDIPPKSQPTLVAQWKVLGTAPSVGIQAPTTLSFSALVFETEGT